MPTTGWMGCYIAGCARDEARPTSAVHGTSISLIRPPAPLVAAAIRDEAGEVGVGHRVARDPVELLDSAWVSCPLWPSPYQNGPGAIGSQ
ncbi:MAG: hypothetical protein MI924_01010 [Chloroflexales bacterium]|nr:hypothetical protein [Chloroflexales bacterium]